MCAQCNNVTNKWHHCVGDVAEDALVLGENAMTKSTPNYRVLPQTQSVTGCCCWWDNVTSLYCHYVIFGNGNPTTGQLTSSGEKCKELRDPPPPTGEWHPYYWLSSKCLCFMDIPLNQCGEARSFLLPLNCAAKGNGWEWETGLMPLCHFQCDPEVILY